MKKKAKTPKKERKPPETTWGKIWHFIWYDDSILSWIANIILAFLIIKFIIYPLLALAFGTGLPVVAVVSSSMEHDGSFDDWWASQAICDNLQVCPQEEWYSKKNITKQDFKDYRFTNGFNKGDLILLSGVDQEDIRVGDVLVYNALAKTIPIIHRAVDLQNETEFVYGTKGDHNPYQIKKNGLDETNITYDQTRGLAFGRIPYVGYVKIWFANLINTFSGKSNDYSNVDVVIS